MKVLDFLEKHEKMTVIIVGILVAVFATLAIVWPTWASNITDNSTIQIKNPTFEELRTFILSDNTSRSQFILNKYECRHFATDVNNNADAVGIRCAFVLLCFAQGQHAVVAFDTTDRGLTYIEPQTDAAIEPKVGSLFDGQVIKEILTSW